MDLRSIINSDASGSTRPPREQASQPPPRIQVRREQVRGTLVSPPASFQESNQTRPAPPPLQPLAKHDFRSPGGNSSLNSAQSPYQHTPSSSAPSGGQYPFPQYPHNQSPGQPPQSASHLEGFSSAPSSSHQTHFPYVQGSPLSHSQSATTPGGSYYYGQHQQSHSAQSSPTPTSAQSQSAFQHRGSPASVTSPSYPHAQHYISHQSQPATPLGPPATFSRSSTGPQREQSNPYAHQRRPSSSSHSAGLQVQANSPTHPIGVLKGIPMNLQNNPDPLRRTDPVRSRSYTNYATQRERERSISVSPKTRLHNPADQEAEDGREWNGQVTPAKRKYSDQSDGRTMSGGDHQGESARTVAIANARETLIDNSGSPATPQSGQLNGALRESRPQSQSLAADDGSNQEYSKSTDTQEAKRSSNVSHISGSESTQAGNTKEIGSSDSRGTVSLAPSPMTATPKNSITPPPSSSLRKLPTSQSLPNVGGMPPSGSSMSPAQPAKKRARYTEPPIFARKAGRSTSNSPIGSHRRPLGTSTGTPIKHEIKPPQPPPLQHGDSNNPSQDSNGVTQTQVDPPVAIPQSQPLFVDDGPLGRWEPSITNLTPYEEITRVVADFLFMQVVERGDVGAATAGSIPGQGGQLEIEAKLGQLIDKNTNDRLRLPIMTESILNNDDPSMRTMFKSSMTEAQHRNLNQYLNNAVIHSQPPKQPQVPAEGANPKPRTPISYVHTRERDRFFDLPPSAIVSMPLPASVRPHVNPRHKMKLRVTTDQKSGAPLAKIVKVRLADLDVYSPRTPFDWRLSVNLELTYMGDTDGLVEILEGGRKSDRNKDRMTYRHQAYQIDLTQVTMQSEIPSKPDKEHELEIEVSAEKIREQGLLAKRGQITQYEDLVKGFVDNVRTVARVVT
ncbi:MAG: mRNA-capping enzyme subunit beta [Sclerophora amabilis]|nr:MAG: mRNA-capping enzyme subunit beta [Sclerophora amabilis]